MTKKKPIIGITLDSVASDNDKYKYATKPWYALRRGYSEIVDELGGIAVLIPYSEDTQSYANLIDGLIIPGGDEDINPKFYGQSINTDKIKTNDERATFELNLLAAALKRRIPVLGICNGLQVINTHFGGTLFQHLPDSIASDINHEQPHPKHLPSHDIIIEQGSMLASLTKDLIVQVNSTHHQAIDKLGAGLEVSAKAPDGVIEAIEASDYEFVIGVEWHPEHLNSELDKNLFSKLVDASKNNM